PIGEETFFRGFATAAWARVYGPTRAIVQGALFFAFVHVLTIAAADFSEGTRQALIAFVVRVPVALALGWLFLRRRSIYAPMGLHAIVLQQRTGSRAIRELPVSERPRERLALRGAAGLTSAELIALLWGSGSRGMSAVELAEEALGRYEGLTGLARATGMELEAISGVGEVKAAQLAAAFELGRRLMADWPSGRWTIRAPKDVADRLVLQMGRLEHEELRVVLLNTKNVVLRVVTVYQGNVSSS